MSKKNILKTTIVHSAALMEYMVRCTVDGVRKPEMDYFTSDKEDAQRTEIQMHVDWGKKHREEERKDKMATVCVIYQEFSYLVEYKGRYIGVHVRAPYKVADLSFLDTGKAQAVDLDPEKDTVPQVIEHIQQIVDSQNAGTY